MTGQPLQFVGLHANQVARNCKNEKMQEILQWVGVGSVILMGLAASVHLVKDLMQWKSEPYSRRKHLEILDDLDRHYSKKDDRDHGHGR